MAQKRRPAKTRRKKKSHRRLMKRILILLCVMAVLTFSVSLIYTVFQTKEIQVTGNQFTPTQEVTEWIKAGRFSDNSLYVLWKYNLDSTEQLPSVQSVSVKMKSPWVLEVQVNEKELTGRIAYGKEFLYFDVDGIACLVTSEVLEGIPYIEGVKVDKEEVVLGEKTPVEDDKIFEQLNEVSRYLTQLEMIPDRIIYDDSGITIYFGGVRVMLGTGGFEEKLKQVPPILAKLNEQYPGQTGTLHLENYEAGVATVRFVPEVIE